MQSREGQFDLLVTRP
nr:unnamed protein product [Callosobruchus chinensis]CAH7749516.1 unnamed protein product [Callosobruchus chinensis]CAH7764849.1 unnamed protein product [Callosobruchus chinensis]